MLQAIGAGVERRGWLIWLGVALIGAVAGLLYALECAASQQTPLSRDGGWLQGGSRDEAHHIAWWASSLGPPYKYRSPMQLRIGTPCQATI